MKLSHLSAIILASGRASRFGENKLLHPIDGKPMIEKLFSSIPSGLFEQVIVVSTYSDILTISKKYGYVAVRNEDTTNDIAKTIALGMAEINPLCRGCMVFVSDQPWLTTRTIQELAAHFCEESEKIHVPLCNGKQGNPVIFPSRYFTELSELPPDHGGKYLCKKYPEAVSFLPVLNPLELKDIDKKTDLLSVRK